MEHTLRGGESISWGRGRKIRQYESAGKWWTDKDMDEKKERERDLLMFTLGNQYRSPPPLLLQRALVSGLWCPLLTGVELRRIQSMPVIITVYLGLSIHKRNAPLHLHCIKHEAETLSIQKPLVFAGKIIYSLKIVLQRSFLDKLAVIPHSIIKVIKKPHKYDNLRKGCGFLSHKQTFLPTMYPL